MKAEFMNEKCVSATERAWCDDGTVDVYDCNYDNEGYCTFFEGAEEISCTNKTFDGYDLVFEGWGNGPCDVEEGINNACYGTGPGDTYRTIYKCTRDQHSNKLFWMKVESVSCIRGCFSEDCVVEGYE